MRLTSITLTEHLQRAGKTDAPERILLFLSEQAKIESLSDSSEPVVNAPRVLKHIRRLDTLDIEEEEPLRPEDSASQGSFRESLLKPITSLFAAPTNQASPRMSTARANQQIVKKASRRTMHTGAKRPLQDVTNIKAKPAATGSVLPPISVKTARTLHTSSLPKRRLGLFSKAKRATTKRYHVFDEKEFLSNPGPISSQNQPLANSKSDNGQNTLDTASKKCTQSPDNRRIDQVVDTKQADAKSLAQERQCSAAPNTQQQFHDCYSPIRLPSEHSFTSRAGLKAPAEDYKTKTSETNVARPDVYDACSSLTRPTYQPISSDLAHILCDDEFIVRSGQGPVYTSPSDDQFWRQEDELSIANVRVNPFCMELQIPSRIQPKRDSVIISTTGLMRNELQVPRELAWRPRRY